MPPSRRPPTSRADADRIGGPKVARSLPGGKRQDRRELSMPPGRALPFQIRQAAARRKLSLPIPSLCRRYARPRDAEPAVLYRVIDEHLEAFLETARRNADGSPLPEFVEQEFRDFLTCGLLAHGFARLRCTDCAFERLVPFSCKGRGFCPSCGGRRMKRSAPCSRGSPRGCSACSSAVAAIRATLTCRRLTQWWKNLLFWPASAAPRSRGESLSVLARARACGAWGAIPTRRGCSRPLRGTRIWRASISTPTSRCWQQIALGWSNCAAICSVRGWLRTGSGSLPMAASGSRSRPPG